MKLITEKLLAFNNIQVWCIFLIGFFLPAHLQAQIIEEASLDVRQDSASAGSPVDIVAMDVGWKAVERVTFDGLEAAIVEQTGSLIRVILPDGLRFNTRPVIRVYGEPDASGFGPLIIPFQIEGVYPQTIKIGDEARVSLFREIISNKMDASAPNVIVLLNGVEVSSGNISERSVHFIIDDTYVNSHITFLDNLKGYSDVDLRVSIDGQNSRQYSSPVRIQLPLFNTARIITLIGLLYAIGIAFYLPILRKRRLQRKKEKSAEGSEEEGATVGSYPPAGALPTIKSYLPDDPPDDLINAINRGQCILFAGGGLAAQSGFPTWLSFLEDLIDFAHERESLSEGNVRRLKTSLKRGEIDLVAEELSSELSNAEIRRYFNGINAGKKPSSAHRVLSKLPFAGIITTGFDRLINEVYGNDSLIIEDTDFLLNALRDKDFFILHLFGSYSRASRLLLSPGALNQTIKSYPRFRQFISTLFQRYTVFFVGTSLEGIRIYLKDLELSAGESARNHYALIGEPGGVNKTLAQSLERDYRITTLDFGPSEGYPEIESFLKKIKVEKSRDSKEHEAHQRTDTPPVLTRVILENIGPFEKLDLSFNDTWNVFLGDNGVGKTVILRAIAAALCGEQIRDAPPIVRETVESLLRVSNRKNSNEPEVTRGKIELYAGEQRYFVVLEKDAVGKVHLRSESLSPLLIDNWLVLSFPALRSITRDRFSESMEMNDGVSHPVLEDVYPILAGTPDTRLSSLKQWIFKLDYRRAKEDKRAGEILSRFWDLLNDLTPDINLEASEEAIDPVTGRITLKTEDGDVPVESLSQGTSALICWAGTLMQRLYEVHASKEDPLSAGAIVMIDEIAAHTHPAWQRELLMPLKNAFPKVQFIVNTHSPLVVAGQPIEQVFRFSRDEEGNVVRLEVAEDMTMGRTDQVLMSDLFGLETTLDPITEGEMQKYQRLLGKEKRTADEEAQFQELGQSLEFRIPVSYSAPQDRLAYELVKGILREQLGEDDEDEPLEKNWLLRRAEALLKQAQPRLVMKEYVMKEMDKFNPDVRKIVDRRVDQLFDEIKEMRGE